MEISLHRRDREVAWAKCSRPTKEAPFLKVFQQERRTSRAVSRHFFLCVSNFYKGSSELGFDLTASLSAQEPHPLFVPGLYIHFTINSFCFLHCQIKLSLRDRLLTVSFFELQRWPSQRIIQHTTSHTKLTRMVSRSPRGIATLPPKGYFPFYLVNFDL